VKSFETVKRLMRAVCERGVFDAAWLELAVYAVGLCDAVCFVRFGEILDCEAIEERE
jgi:hypothetical protein